MKKTLKAIAAALCLLVIAGCHEIEEYPNTYMGNFDQLWQFFSEHYCNAGATKATAVQLL